MFENYLIHPRAIAALLNEIGARPDKMFSESEIREWIEKDASSRNDGMAQAFSAAWLGKVNGADLLSRLTSALSDARHEFSKTAHGPMLVEWLLEHDPRHLNDPMEFLKECVTSEELPA